MKRIAIQPRPNWQETIRRQGFVYFDPDYYYNEQTAYRFTKTEVEDIEKATADIFELCLKVVQHVLDGALWEAFHIPPQFAGMIRRSWEEDAPSFYGRFDLAYTEDGIKLLEFNADTPTGLLEASVVQWYWLQEWDQSMDQFNSLHEKLMDHMSACKPYLHPAPLYFSCKEEFAEDFMTTKYLQDCAVQGAIDTDFIPIDKISIDGAGRFVTDTGLPLRNVFKLYPWEWMFREEFAPDLLNNEAETMWIEPPWKAILSNKMLLPYLYQLFPDSPYILPAFYERTGGMPDYVRKPVFSREGANTSVVLNGVTAEEGGDGDYGREGFIYQQYTPLPEFDGNRVVIGSWVVGGEPAGMGLRESANLITNNTSRFVPHFFR